MKEVTVQTKEKETIDHILDVETQDVATQVEAAELQNMEEVTLLKIEVSKWKHHARQFDEGMISLIEHKNIIQELRNNGLRRSSFRKFDGKRCRRN